VEETLLSAENDFQRFTALARTSGGFTASKFSGLMRLPLPLMSKAWATFLWTEATSRSLLRDGETG
jgi:hypothetical protein